MHVHRKVLSSTKGAASAGQVYPQLARREPETRRDLNMVLVEPLGGDVEVHTPGAVWDRKPGFRTHERLVLNPHLIGALDDHISDRFGGTAANWYRSEDVAVRVNRWCFCGRLGIRHWTEDLVLHDNRLGRTAACIWMVRGHDRHGFTLVAHDIAGQHRLVGHGESVRRVARNVLGRQHRYNSGNRQCWTYVDVDDQRVSVRRPQGSSPEHPVGLEI